MTVGIADTLYMLPDEDIGDIRVGNREDFSPDGENVQNKWGHGYRILDVISSIVPNARFHFYRLKAERHRLKGGSGLQSPDDSDVSYTESPSIGEGGNARIIQCIEQAIDDGVDVLNVSAGRHHHNCGSESCVFRKHILPAIDGGTNVVAACGNERGRRGEHVLCPALFRSTVGVGGFVNECDGYVPDTGTDDRLVADVSNYHRIDGHEQGPFCSMGTCGTGASCDDRRRERWWNDNVRPFKGKPDLLAPVHKPELQDGQNVVFIAGTSFATPIVTGAVASLRGEFSNSGPEEIRNTLVETGTEIDDEISQSPPPVKLDATQARQYLRQTSRTVSDE